jgi:predicted metal-dependent peptidase
VATAAVTEKCHLLYNPRWLSSLTVKQAATLVVHEMWHVLRLHGSRREALGSLDGAELGVWKVAADLEINDDLRGSSWDLPPGGWVPELVDLPGGKTAEWYFAELKQASSAKESSGGSSKESPDGSYGEPPTDSSEESPRGGPPTGEPPLGDSPDEGSGAGSPLPDEDALVGDVAGRDPVDVEAIRRSVAEAVENHVKSAGSVPGGVERWAKEVLGPPVVPWRTLLARSVQREVAYRTGKVDFRRDRVTGRMVGVSRAWGGLHRTPIQPRMVRPDNRVALVVDTSASMGEEELGLCLREVRGCLREFEGGVTVLSADCTVHRVEEVFSGRAVRLFGGGGTSFVPAFEVLRKMQPRPGVVVYLTDGWGRYPSRAPSWCSVVWVLIGDGAYSPPWGKVVRVKLGD